ncbi:MAG TPA: hypothetical protein VGH80_00730 [Xanthomonadaceae bacterium]|jgi:hypothetical protein
MKMVIAIAIPVLLMLALILGIGGKGYAIVAIVLAIAGGYCVAGPMPPTKRRWFMAAIYVFLFGGGFFLFS